MYEISVHREFNARHAVTLQGVPEEPHTHAWQVDVYVAAEQLDEDGVVCDFRELDEALRAITVEFEGQDLNQLPQFETIGPTAEHVARYIAEKFTAALGDTAPVTVRRVTVLEAPGCTATYFSPAP